MIKTESFLTLFLIFYCPIAIVTLTLLYFFGDTQYSVAATWGSALSIALVWITVLGLNVMIHSSIIKLQAIVMGGFFFRFFIILFSSFAVHYFTQLHLESFIAGLFVSYIFLQILEIIYIQGRFSNLSDKR